MKPDSKSQRADCSLQRVVRRLCSHGTLNRATNRIDYHLWQWAIAVLYYSPQLLKVAVANIKLLPKLLILRLQIAYMHVRIFKRRVLLSHLGFKEAKLIAQQAQIVSHNCGRTVLGYQFLDYIKWMKKGVK